MALSRVLRYVKIVALPLGIGVALPSIVSLYMIFPMRIGRIEFILNALITCAVTFTGFLMTAIAILVGMSDSSIMRYIIRKEELMSELICRYSFSLILGTGLILFCIVAGYRVDASGTIWRGTFIICAGVSVAFFISIVITGYYSLWIVSLFSKEPPKGNGSLKPQGEYRIGPGTAQTNSSGASAGDGCSRGVSGETEK